MYVHVRMKLLFCCVRLNEAQITFSRTFNFTPLNDEFYIWDARCHSIAYGMKSVTGLYMQ